MSDTVILILSIACVSIVVVLLFRGRFNFFFKGIGIESQMSAENFKEVEPPKENVEIKDQPRSTTGTVDSRKTISVGGDATDSNIIVGDNIER